MLAHPVQLRTENDAQLERVVKDLVDLGLAGLEVDPQRPRRAAGREVRRARRPLQSAEDRRQRLPRHEQEGHQPRQSPAAGEVPREFFDALRDAARERVGSRRNDDATRARGAASVFDAATHRRRRTTLDLPTLNAMFERQQPQQIVEWAAAQFGRELVMTSSLRRRVRAAAPHGVAGDAGHQGHLRRHRLPVPRDARVHGAAPAPVRPERLDLPHAERPDRLAAHGRRGEPDLAEGRRRLLRRQQERADGARDARAAAARRGSAASAATRPRRARPRRSSSGRRATSATRSRRC